MRSFCEAKIWVEETASFWNLIILVIFPAGLKFSATFPKGNFRVNLESVYKLKKSLINLK
jgi:hypothetical protein